MIEVPLSIHERLGIFARHNGAAAAAAVKKHRSQSPIIQFVALCSTDNPVDDLLIRPSTTCGN